jgi:hypothetical protein
MEGAWKDCSLSLLTYATRGTRGERFEALAYAMGDGRGMKER